MPFLSPQKLISHPDTQTFSVIFPSSFAWGRKQTQEVLCCAVVGTPLHTPPLPATQLVVGRWDGKQVSPMTFSSQTLQASQSGALQGVVVWATHELLYHFSSHSFPTDKYEVTSHSLSVLPSKILLPSESGSCVQQQFYCTILFFILSSPWSYPSSGRWPLRQRREHKVITFKSQWVAYVKPETFGKSAAQEGRCESRLCLCPQCVCQRCSDRPLCFPHKKKINSADYQASIKYLLLTSHLEKLMPCPGVHDGRSYRG